MPTKLASHVAMAPAAKHKQFCVTHDYETYQARRRSTNTKPTHPPPNKQMLGEFLMAAVLM